MKPKLISTIAEVQNNVAVNMTSDFDVVAPYLASAESTYVVRFIGKAQFDALVEYYDADTLEADDNAKAEAVKAAHKVIANLGYAIGMPVLSLSIGSAGIQINTNENAKQAFQWQVNDLKDSLMELGFNGIEELLVLLESDPETFDKYAESDEFKRQKQLLINTAADFDLHYNIRGSRVIFQTIGYIIKRIEDQTIAKLVGHAFLASLKEADLSEAKQQLVDRYLKPAIALMAIAKAVVERVISLERGTVGYNFNGRTENMKETQAATNQQVAATCQQLTDDANTYLQDGMQFIKDNIGDFAGFEPPLPRRRFKFKNDPNKGVFGV